MHTKNIKTFRREVKRLFRQQFRGNIGAIAFQEALNESVASAYRRAFNLGLKVCGFTFDELRTDEQFSLTQKILEAKRQVPQVSFWLRTEAVSVKQVLARADLWVVRYEDVRGLAKSLVCGDRKFIWVYDPAKENCLTCKALNGKVKRNSFWTKNGIMPGGIFGLPNTKIKCEGWNCGCRLLPTDKPLSRGPLPRLP